LDYSNLFLKRGEKIKNQEITFKSFIPLLFIILTLIFCSGTVSAVKVIYINTTGSDTTGNGTANNPYHTIQKGVDNVDPNGLIKIANGQYSGINNTKITLNKNIKITGQSSSKTIIDGKGTDWLFKIQPGVNVTICNIKLTRGYIEGSGGAIQNQGILSINGCYMENNTANEYGGAIYNYCSFNVNNSGFNFCVLNLNNCNLKGNHAHENGGAISNQCTINTESSSIGNCVLNLNYCTISKNTADHNGGAISNNCAINSKSSSFGNCVLNLNYCTISKNTAGHNGGAISNQCTINMDSACLGACVLNLNDCIFTDNKSGDNGGALSNQGTVNISGSGLGACVLNVSRSVLKDNNTNGNGGAILNLCIVNISDSGVTKESLNVIESTLTFNIAYRDGGAIWNDGTANIHFNRFFGNISHRGKAIHTDTRMIATDNWWGSNYPNFKSLISASLKAKVNYSPWLYLTFTSSPKIISVGSISSLTASFNQHTKGTIITPINPTNGHIPDGTPVIFNTDLGNVGSKSVRKYTVSGLAYAILRGDEGAGIARLQLITDDQKLKNTVVITDTDNTAAVTIGMQKTGSPLTGIILAILMISAGLINSLKKGKL